MPKTKLIAACGAALAVAAALPSPVAAQSEPYIGQIMWVGGNFCPRGWISAAGQQLAIQQNLALFSLLGTTYGGNGQTTFALPDLRGRVTIGPGQGPGLSSRVQGEMGGVEATTLLASQLPAHVHSASAGVVMRANSGAGTTSVPTGAVLAGGGATRAYSTGTADVDLDATAISGQSSLGIAGGGQPFANAQPSLVLNACIAFAGLFPPRP